MLVANQTAWLDKEGEISDKHSRYFPTHRTFFLKSCVLTFDGVLSTWTFPAVCDAFTSSTRTPILGRRASANLQARQLKFGKTRFFNYTQRKCCCNFACTIQPKIELYRTRASFTTYQVPPKMSRPLNSTAKAATGNGNGRPPVAPDLNQVLNSISLSVSKHRGLLASLSKHRPSSPSNTLNTSASNSKPKSGGFSAILQQKSGSTTPAEKEDDAKEDDEQRRVPDHEEEIRSILNQPPNSGLGWVPPKSENGFDKLAGGGAMGSKEERELRRKMGLKWQGGLNGLNGMKRKKIELEESESEEEVGRAGAVRARGKRRGVVSAAAAADMGGGKAAKGAGRGRGAADEAKGRGAVPVPVPISHNKVQDEEGGKPAPADKPTTTTDDQQHQPDADSGAVASAASAVQETKPTIATLPTGETSKSEGETAGTAGTAGTATAEVATAAAKKKKENENRKKKKNKKKNRRKADVGEGATVDGKEAEMGNGGGGEESE